MLKKIHESMYTTSEVFYPLPPWVNTIHKTFNIFYKHIRPDHPTFSKIGSRLQPPPWKIPSWKIPTGKHYPENIPPWKISPRKMPFWKIPSRRKYSTPLPPSGNIPPENTPTEKKTTENTLFGKYPRKLPPHPLRKIPPAENSPREK